MTDAALMVEQVQIAVSATPDVTVVIASDPDTGAAVVEVQQVAQVVVQDVIAVEVGQPGTGNGADGDPAGTAASLLAAHVASADPHPQYLDEGDAIDGGNF